MVQIQSMWFYNRNRQKYVPNIIFASPVDCVKQTMSVYRPADRPSAVWLPYVP